MQGSSKWTEASSGGFANEEPAAFRAALEPLPTWDVATCSTDNIDSAIRATAVGRTRCVRGVALLRAALLYLLLYLRCSRRHHGSGSRFVHALLRRRCTAVQCFQVPFSRKVLGLEHDPVA